MIAALQFGRHQILPIAVAGLSGKTSVEGDWFVMNVHISTRKILPDQSDGTPPGSGMPQLEIMVDPLGK